MPMMLMMLMGLTVLAWAPYTWATTAEPTTRPNVLLLVAEDLSPRIGAYGDSVAHTPNLDQLAMQSVRYTAAFTTAGVCAPSRAALLTGLHQISFGAQHMRTSTGPLGEYYALPPVQARAFPELLREQGYYTYTDTKLDYQFSGIRAGTGPFTIWDLEAAPDTAWRKRAPGQPFFGLINFLETHESGVMRQTGAAHSQAHRASQQMRAKITERIKHRTNPEHVQVPPYYPDTPVTRQDIARHYTNIRLMDERVGRILQALRADGLADSTIIIWTTDHGDGLPRAKRELFDSGIHVPMLLHHPQRTQLASVDDRLVSFVDLAPTILALAGAPIPTYLHGRDFIKGALRQYIYASRDRIDEVMDRQRAIRGSRYKLIKSWHPSIPGGHALAYRDNLDMVRAWRHAYQQGQLTPVQAQWFEPVGESRLYDLKQDPHELNNLAQDPALADKLTQLSEQLDAFLTRVGDTSEQGEADMRRTMLKNGAVQVTPAPIVQRSGSVIRLVSPTQSSIGYRFTEDTAWRVYRQPVDLRSGQNERQLEAKAVRYGWQESQIVTAGMESNQASSNKASINKASTNKTPSQAEDDSQSVKQKIGVQQ